MSEVSKRYVKGLIKAMNESEIDSSFDLLSEIALAFNEKKFTNILLSSTINKETKENFLLSLVKNADTKLVNFVKLLSENDRLDQIPHIVKELENQISLRKNQFKGLVISNFEVGDEQISTIENNLSKKFDAEIKLDNVITDYPGVKVEIDSLGVEIGFSTERLKAQIAEHILKVL